MDQTEVARQILVSIGEEQFRVESRKLVIHLADLEVEVDKTAKVRNAEDGWNISELHVKTTTERSYLEQSISYFYLYHRIRAPFLAFLRKNKTEERGWKRDISIFDHIFRLFAIGAPLAATMTMATTDETLPFFTDHFQFYAIYDDLPSPQYLVLSLPFSIMLIICPSFVGLRFLLIIFDLAMLVLTTTAASAATSVVALAHTGNSKANWVAICLRFDGFCQQISGVVVASFVGMVFIVTLVSCLLLISGNIDWLSYHV